MRGSKRLRWSADSSSGGTFASAQDLLVSRERSGGSDLVAVPEEGLQLQVGAAAWCLLPALWPGKKSWVQTGAAAAGHGIEATPVHAWSALWARTLCLGLGTFQLQAMFEGADCPDLLR